MSGTRKEQGLLCCLKVVALYAQAKQASAAESSSPNFAELDEKVEADMKEVSSYYVFS